MIPEHTFRARTGLAGSLELFERLEQELDRLDRIFCCGREGAVAFQAMYQMTEEQEEQENQYLYSRIRRPLTEEREE